MSTYATITPSLCSVDIPLMLKGIRGVGVELEIALKKRSKKTLRCETIPFLSPSVSPGKNPSEDASCIQGSPSPSASILKSVSFMFVLSQIFSLSSEAEKPPPKTVLKLYILFKKNSRALLL